MASVKSNIDQSLEILQTPKTKFSDLLNYLEKSPLAGSYDFGFPNPPPVELAPKDVEKICKEFQKLLLDDLTYDKLTALYVASSLTYLMSSSFQDFECRTELLHRTFRYTNNLDPVNLHIAAKRMHESLKSNTNLLFLCKNICFSSDMGNAISLCLIWAMLLEAFDKPIEMYCFHPFSVVNDLIAEVDINDMMKRKETIGKAAFLLQLIAVLVTNIVSSSHEEFEKAGYREYFQYDLESIHTLRDWAKTANQHLNVSVEKSNTNFELTLAIKETLAFSIISPLDDKLKAMDGGRDHFGLTHSLC